MLTIRLADSGLKAQVGFSWSNRTELVKHDEVRGHIGITFDPAPLILAPEF
jgi:hypothetical protein